MSESPAVSVCVGNAAKAEYASGNGRFHEISVHHAAQSRLVCRAWQRLKQKTTTHVATTHASVSSVVIANVALAGIVDDKANDPTTTTTTSTTTTTTTTTATATTTASTTVATTTIKHKTLPDDTATIVVHVQTLKLGF